MTESCEGLPPHGCQILILRLDSYWQLSVLLSLEDLHSLKGAQGEIKDAFFDRQQVLNDLLASWGCIEHDA